MPGSFRWIVINKRGRVLLALHAFGCAKGNNFTGTLPRPLVRVSIVQDAQVVGLPRFSEAQGSLTRGVCHFVERAHFIVFAPDPAPPLSLLPFGERFGSRDAADKSHCDHEK